MRLEKKGDRRQRQSARMLRCELLHGQSQHNPIPVESDSCAVVPIHACAFSPDSALPLCLCDDSLKNQNDCSLDYSPKCTTRPGGCRTFCLFGGFAETARCPVLGSVVSHRSVSTGICRISDAIYLQESEPLSPTRSFACSAIPQFTGIRNPLLHSRSRPSLPVEFHT